MRTCVVGWLVILLQILASNTAAAWFLPLYVVALLAFLNCRTQLVQITNIVMATWFTIGWFGYSFYTIAVCIAALALSLLPRIERKGLVLFVVFCVAELYLLAQAGLFMGVPAITGAARFVFAALGLAVMSQTVGGQYEQA